MTDSDGEEVRGCSDVLVGRLGVWWYFRHCDTSNDFVVNNDGCADYNCGTDHHRCPRHDGYCFTDYYCRTDEHWGTDHHGHCCTDHHCRPDHHCRTNNRPARADL